MAIRFQILPSNHAYKIGSNGTVWSCWQKVAFHGYTLGNQWHELSPKIDKRGYRHVILCSPIDQNRRYAKVTHLVLEAFVGPKPEKMVACHRNDIKGDDRLENLRWDTPSMNSHDAIRNDVGPYGERHGRTSLTTEQALMIHHLRNEGRTYKAIGEMLNISSSGAYAIASGRNWKYLGRS